MTAEFVSASEMGRRGARALPGRLYASQEVFELESERIFRRHWLCAGREEQAKQPGDYFVCGAGSESVLLIRGRDGELRAFHNVCRHRGARLCDQAAGRISGGIRCPYHAWTYGVDGRLLAAPSMDGAEGFDRSQYPLIPVHTALWEGFAFINLAPEPAPFDRSHAAVIGRFGRFNLPLLTTVRRIEYNVRANWKLLFQNYSECYHCPVIHPALTRLTPAESGANDLTAGAFLGGYMTVTMPGGSMSESGRACAAPLGKLPAEDLQRVYYYTLFPNMFLSLHPDYVMTHLLWPAGPAETRVECEWLFHPDAHARPGFDPEDGIRFWDRTNREDWQICERTQLGVSSRAFVPGPYSPHEGVVAAFDAEYLRIMGPGMLAPA